MTPLSKAVVYVTHDQDLPCDPGKPTFPSGPGLPFMPKGPPGPGGPRSPSKPAGPGSPRSPFTPSAPGLPSRPENREASLLGRNPTMAQGLTQPACIGPTARISMQVPPNSEGVRAVLDGGRNGGGRLVGRWLCQAGEGGWGWDAQFGLCALLGAAPAKQQTQMGPCPREALEATSLALDTAFPFWRKLGLRPQSEKLLFLSGVLGQSLQTGGCRHQQKLLWCQWGCHSAGEMQQSPSDGPQELLDYQGKLYCGSLVEQ